ncbi:MAG: L-glutamate gamma-semialdehyde dehydrogenase [Gemmatimonadota bacterium]
MATITADFVTGFQNEPMTDFSDTENVRRMQAALATVRARLGERYPLIIDGEEIHDGPTADSVNPGRPDEVVGSIVQAGTAQARRAIEAADRAFESWRKVPAEERAEVLLRAAEMLRERKFEYAALMVHEVSKSWPEADGDVAELIDFAAYYAREAIRLGGSHPMHPYPGEDNQLRYIPLGVTVVIPPWNFPGAIMGGMTMAAIVSGNTVVLKPASTSPVIAAWFSQLLIEAGLPAGVLNFLPGSGSEIGDLLVDHPRTRMIAFTGSKEVGLRIYERASKVHEGQLWLKRTILEMGGKDAILVDETADLDAAAAGIVASAFGFQGQKCSACSRAIVVDEVYDEVLEKVVEGARKLTMGDPTDQGTFMGAVIDAKAFAKIREYIEIGGEEGRVMLGGQVDEDADGYFIPPTIVADVAPDARLAQEEIFGPVLAFIRARDFEDGLDIVNNTEYGLTGALYSHSQERLERAAEDFHVGNLYLNRKCTGALVGVQPFGGFNMSGTDSKAGGPDYLPLFMQGKSVTRRLD